MSFQHSILFLSLLLTGCAASRQMSEQSRDSVFFRIESETVLRDTILFVPLPEGAASAVIPDSDTSHLRTSLAESDAWVTRGKLHHTLRNREAILPIRVSVPERITLQEKGLIRERKVIETIEVEKELSRWQRFIQSLGYAALVAAAAWMARRLARLVR